MADQKSATELKYLVRNNFLYLRVMKLHILGRNCPFSFIFGMCGSVIVCLSHVEFQVLSISSFGDWLP